MERFGKNPQYQLYYDDPDIKLVAIYWNRFRFGILVRRINNYPWEHIGFITEKGWKWINQFLKLQQEESKRFEKLSNQEPEKLEGW